MLAAGRGRLVLAAAAGAGLVLVGCGLGSPAGVRPITPVATPASGQALSGPALLSVAGNQLLRDGVSFAPRGLTLTGFLGPVATLSPPYMQARDAFGPDELAAARGFGADTIRFLIDQQAVAPPVGSGGVAFRRSLFDAVVNARAMGLNVIVALGASAAAGDTRVPLLPDASTAAAWGVLAPLFAADLGVAYEIFNAPAPTANASTWLTWADGGSLPGQPTVTGMRQLVEAIRGTGSRNVLIVDGLDRAHTLDGAPIVPDPAGALIYGVEPYQRADDGSATWDRDFGTVARSRPVLASEWGAASVTAPGTPVSPVCDASTPAVADSLLRYLEQHHIGVIGFAFDLAGTLVRDESFALTSYDRFACGTPGGGPGELLSAAFRAQGA